MEPQQSPQQEPTSYGGRTIFFVFIALAIWWYWGTNEPQMSAPIQPAPSQFIQPDKTFNQGSTYLAPYSPSSAGYGCTIDCSGHEAGQAWAELNAIEDEDDCSGNSQSFIEGCQAYVQENAEEKTEEASE